jgi:hypothetical protein
MLCRYRHKRLSQNQCDDGLLFNDADLNTIVRSDKQSNGPFRQLMVRNQSIVDYRWVLESDNNNFWPSCDREYKIESVNPLILVDESVNPLILVDESVNPLILVDEILKKKYFSVFQYLREKKKRIRLQNNSRLYPRWDVQKLVCETSFESDDPKYWLENIAAHSILKPAEKGTDFEPFCG